MKDKPNCYECKYRRSISGDAHSSCAHPGISKILNSNPLISAMAIMYGVKPTNEKSNIDIIVVGNEHGIKSGWFLWPINFDPVWLNSCTGFKNKDSN